MLQSFKSNICLNKRFYTTTLNSLNKNSLKLSSISNGITLLTYPDTRPLDPKNNTTSLNNNYKLTFLWKFGTNIENKFNNGINNVFNNLIKSDTKVNKWLLKNGITWETHLSREYNIWNFSFTKDTLTKDNKVESLLKIIDESLSNSLENLTDINKFDILKKISYDQIIALEENPKSAVVEHLHSTAFQNTPLALPILGTEDSMEILQLNDLKMLIKNYYNNYNNLIVSTNSNDTILHENWLELLSKTFTSSASVSHQGAKPELSTFLGSEVRVRDDTLPKAWVNIAVESVPFNTLSKKYWIAKLSSSIMGNYNCMEPRSRLQGIKLLNDIQEYQLCESFNHFNFSYKNTGLWGFQTVFSNFDNIDDMIHFTLKQWNRLTISITKQELDRGKNMLKLNYLSNQFNSKSLAIEYFYNSSSPDNKNLDDINKVVDWQRINTINLIDSITIRDIKDWSTNYIWDQDIAIAGMGQIEGLLDYMRMRNDMSMMRW